MSHNFYKMGEIRVLTCLIQLSNILKRSEEGHDWKLPREYTNVTQGNKKRYGVATSTTLPIQSTYRVPDLNYCTS